jgi:Fur family iron response transcriptional regulator
MLTFNYKFNLNEVQGSIAMEYMDTTEKLTAVGLRPTRQRVLLGNLLFSMGCRHVTAESLHKEAKAANIDVSLATVYNTLHQFTEAKLLREMSLESGRSYFDTNTAPHHHFLCESTGELVDIPEEHILLESLPLPPLGMEVSRVDVVIRVSRAPAGLETQKSQAA